MAGYIEILNLAKSYDTPDGTEVVVEDFSLCIDHGEHVCLYGPRDCGKSTVLSIIAGLTKRTAGRVSVAGREVSEPGPDRAVVLQSPCLMPWMTALG